jgi:hypothetical protein
MEAKQIGLYQILKTHLLTLTITYVIYLLTVNMFNRLTHLLISMVLAIVVSILYFVLTEKIHKVYCYVIGIATGFLMSGYFSEYLIDYLLSFYVYLSLISSIMIVHLLMWYFKKYKSILFIYMFFLILVMIYAISFFEVLIYREILYLIIYVFILNIGVLIYVSKTNINVERAINLSFFAAFMLLLFIVLLVITEGESGELVEGFDGLETIFSKDKKKKKQL